MRRVSVSDQLTQHHHHSILSCSIWWHCIYRYQWKQNFDAKQVQRVIVEVVGVYPFKIKKLRHFNVGTAMNLLVSMVRPFFPEYLKTTIEVGYTCEQRLDTLYMVPNAEAANHRLLDRIEKTLRLRYANERDFKL